ncbi:unnamed protein product [Arctia plantaginis]|uniref:Uncharacterized protein n=1 Tax=Arctia plantaginis TaxID=874455 RepID=A0A8S0YX55_ARCPL|nr:unnamed protein product [Arctia plantaginis]
MDDSLKPTIEKIKLQEHDNEVRLKEKRDLNSAMLSLNRAIRDTALTIENLTKEHQALITATDKLEHEVILEKIRQDALAAQVNDCRRELEELQKTSVEGLSSVWERRSHFFEAVQQISDKCDVWALLIRPTCEIKPNVMHVPKMEQIVKDDSKLKDAIERKDKAIAMRNFLLSEPDVGEEFVRTRNALQYSLEIMASDQAE